MHTTTAALTPFASAFRVPAAATPPEAVLTMGNGPDRARVADALASIGWSVTLLDDGWTLLDHLAGARLSGGRWSSPALVVIEIAVAGPRLGALFRRVHGLFPELPVLLVGAGEGAGGRAILRRPFAPGRVLAAVRRAAGSLRAW